MSSPPKLKPPMTSKPTSSRLPPPSLFQGPPSRNASNISLVTPGPLPSNRPPKPTTSGGSKAAPQPAALPRSLSARARQSQAQTDSDRLDALWAEMQNTLAEVELSADSGSHVFGSNHGQALEDLRTAQLGLAQAWARTEAAEEAHEEQERDHGVGGDGSGEVNSAGAKAAGGGGGILSGDDHEGGGFEKDGTKGGLRPLPEIVAGQDPGKGSLEEETEKDIRSARRRREANDRYFERVNTGVLEVVAKLEDVALAMRAVEKESRDIWSESDSLEAASTS